LALQTDSPIAQVARRWRTTAGRSTGASPAAEIYSKVHLADWNGDGKLDLLVGNFCSGSGRNGGNVWLLLGK
jgi:hypothetical protein